MSKCRLFSIKFCLLQEQAFFHITQAFLTFIKNNLLGEARGGTPLFFVMIFYKRPNNVNHYETIGNLTMELFYDKAHLFDIMLPQNRIKFHMFSCDQVRQLQTFLEIKTVEQKLLTSGNVHKWFEPKAQSFTLF